MKYRFLLNTCINDNYTVEIKHMHKVNIYLYAKKLNASMGKLLKNEG